MARGEQILRQWNLLKTLQTRGEGIPLRQLAEESDVSERTIQRDFEVLEELGFPTEHQEDEYGKRFWRLPYEVTHASLATAARIISEQPSPHGPFDVTPPETDVLTAPRLSTQTHRNSPSLPAPGRSARALHFSTDHPHSSRRCTFQPAFIWSAGRKLKEQS